MTTAPPKWTSEHRRSGSFSSDDSRPFDDPNRGKAIEPPVLVYHESARSIVFRDHLRRAQKSGAAPLPKLLTPQESTSFADWSAHSGEVRIANFTPVITPLPKLELSSRHHFHPLMDQDLAEANLTPQEQDVVSLLQSQHATVKTLKNSEWPNFAKRFWTTMPSHAKYPDTHDDIAPNEDDGYPFNSFVTSTTLLPPLGSKMRCFGSTKEYTTGVVFALPQFDSAEAELESQTKTQTWSWPAGYAAKTEFNIDSRGRLINGREEALVSLQGMRERNVDYQTKEDYEIAGHVIKGGLNTIPYNEVFLRVGGIGRSGREKPSLERGVGLPVALFVREASYGQLMALLRTRARVCFLLGQEEMEQLPLLLITPESGVRVLTNELEQELLKAVSESLNPFQNPAIAHKTTMNNTDEAHLQQKMEELLDLDSDNIKETLTQEERARLAGGFGATDDSVAKLLMEAMADDSSTQTTNGQDGSHHLQDIVNEALAFSVRAGDYHTSRQLLILYTLVASKKVEVNEFEELVNGDKSAHDKTSANGTNEEDVVVITDDVVRADMTEDNLADHHPVPAPPPPPPLDTDRLRSATNSDGLLAVLGAAQVLRAMQDGGARRRVEESVKAIGEWVEHGENSIAFRLASWRDQRAAQDDLKIAMEEDSSFMAFISNKAVSNRKAFAKKLQDAAMVTDFESVRFLKAIHEIVSKMHSPCLRLELLQYVLGLDNRYSVAHLARSVELAATCLSISATEPIDMYLENGSNHSPR